MKKLNNRQNQVKSLDFSNHHNFLYKQGSLQKSPQLQKGVSTAAGQTTASIRDPLKQEPINNNIPKKMTHQLVTQQQQQQFGKLFNATPYGQGSSGGIESTTSFQHSPSKCEIPNSKNFRLKIHNSKPANNKAQKIKMGMHKKAASMISSQLPSSISTISQHPLADFTGAGSKNYAAPSFNGLKLGLAQIQGNHLSQNQALKQSQIISSQSSFHDYASNDASANNQRYDPNNVNYTNNAGNDNQKVITKNSQMSHFNQNQQHHQLINFHQPQVLGKGSSMSTQQITDSFGNDNRIEPRFQISQTFDNNQIRDINSGEVTGTNSHSNGYNQNGILSFDNRASLGGNSQNILLTGVNHHQEQNQSQRVSILSSTAITDNQTNNAIKSNKNKIQAYRSHTNSFKTNANQIAVKHPQLKHVKAPTNQNSFEKGKKNLQLYHQRTFSENYQQMPMTTTVTQNGTLNNNTINMNCGTGQSTNRNLKELLKNSNASTNGTAHDIMVSNQNIAINKQMNTTTGLKSHEISHHPQHAVISMTMGTGFGVGGSNGLSQVTGAKTTIGSSRQSVHSSSNIDEKEILLMQYQQKQPYKKEKYNELKNIYDSMMREQMQNTKDELKHIQQQFGGPSRKVVSSNNGSKLNGAQTQSYRASGYVPLGQTILNGTMSGSQVSKLGGNNNTQLKTTPKPLKNKSASKNNSYKQSQNTSAQGNRSSTNNTQVAQQLHQQHLQSSTEKIVKKKPLNVIGMNAITGGIGNNLKINLNGPSGSNQVGDIIKQENAILQGMHRRSASDGNSTFISLTNREHNFGGISYGQNGVNNNYMNNNGAMSSLTNQDRVSTASKNKRTQNVVIPSNMQNSEIPLHIIQKQSQSKKVLLNNNAKDEASSYQVTNSQGTYKVLKNLANNAAAHQRHNSYQFSLVQDKIVTHVSLEGNNKPVKPQSAHKKNQKSNLPPTMLQQNQNSILNQNDALKKIAAKTQSSFRQQHSDIVIEDQSSASQIIQNRAGAGKKLSNPQIEDTTSSSLHKQISLQMSKTPQVEQYNLVAVQQQKQLQQQSLLKQQSYLQPQLKIVEERIETQDSVISDPNLSPRAKINHKLIKKIRLAFQKTNQPPATASEFYKIGKVMGKGAFGKVNLAIHRLSEKFVAVKSINKQFMSEESSKKKVMQEFNILRRTRHKNIVRLYESFETTQHIVFVMEVCGAGDLLTYVRRRRKLKEDVAKHIFKQVIEGLQYCHSKNVLHRDIKLDNILLSSEGDVKICDFGVSKLVKNGEIMAEQCGTPAYIAPEVFENKGYQGYASDIWSAGVVLYAMLYGTVPFKASNMTELQKQITSCQTTFKDEISIESIQLLKGILEINPQKRMTVNEILKHPWIQENTSSINVFTDQEKEKVRQEFAYYNFKNDNADNENGGAGMIVHTDPFTEEMLNSTQNSLIKNNSTKSVVLAPFNSTRTHIDENFHLDQSIQELMIDKKNLKFAPKVREVNRQYEANNNAELDNGVYHQEDEDEEEELKNNNEGNGGGNQNKNSPQKAGPTSIETSFDKENLSLDNSGDNLQGEYGENKQKKAKKQIVDGKKQKDKSEWQQIEHQLKTEEDEEEENAKNATTGNHHLLDSLVIDPTILLEIEKCGFPRQYVSECLLSDELNYATAFYYLLTIIKEY